MSNNPKHIKNKKSNKDFGKIGIGEAERTLILEEIQRDKTILELSAQGLSPNSIADYFCNVLGYIIKPHRIKKMLISFKKKILHVNKKLNEIAGENVVVAMMDETFKGRRGCIFVLMDSMTGYVFDIVWIKNRKKNTIKKVLRPFYTILKKVQLVLTDGAPYFPEIIEDLFPGVKHQICLVHVLRNLYRKLSAPQSRFRSVLKKFSDLKMKKKESIKNLKQKHNSHKKLKQKLRYNTNKRENLRIKYGVKPYESGILKKYPKLRQINLKINNIQAEIRSISKIIRKLKNKISNLDGKINSALLKKNIYWGEYMVECRMLHKFYNLFNYFGKKFVQERKKLINSIPKKTKSPLSKEIIRILSKTKNLNTVNLEGCPIRLQRRFINTNHVESFNSRLRPKLDALRKMGDSEYIQLSLQLFKLRHNLSYPHSGLRKNSCPIERYGYNLKGRTYLDIIFEGLPRGYQYDLFSSEKKLSLDLCQIVENQNLAPII